MFLCVCMIFMRLSSRGKSIVYLYVKCSGRFLLKKQNKKNPPSIDLQSNAAVSKKKGKALSTVGFAVLKRATDHHLCTALLSSMIFFSVSFLDLYFFHSMHYQVTHYPSVMKTHRGKFVKTIRNGTTTIQKISFI